MISSSIRSLALGLILALAAPAQAVEVDSQSEVEQAEPDIELRYVGSRLYDVLYWKIDANGRGEVSAPPSVGYTTDMEHGSDFRYFFQGGVHTFNIGRNGYEELRALLTEVLDGTVDQTTLHETASGDVVAICPEARTLDTASMQLRWSGASEGAFIMPNACLSAEGRELSDRITASWRVLGRHMLHSGQDGVVEDQPPPLSVPAPLQPAVPLALDYHQRNVWTGWELRWHIEADGQGWLDLSEGEHLQYADPSSPVPWTVYITAGQHEFDIGPDGYADIRTALEPYISGPQREADCDGMSDQPLVTLTWANPARAISGQTNTDLGCQEFAMRAGTAERTILSAFVESRSGE